MTTQEFLEKWIGPRVQADGGWLEYVGEDDQEIHIKAKGECARCISQARCIDWVRECIYRENGEKRRIDVQISPFLWRK